MNNTKAVPYSGNGITINYSVDGNERTTHRLFQSIAMVILSMIAGIGAIMTFSTVLNLSIQQGVILPFVVAFSVLFVILYTFVKKRPLIVVAAVCLLLLVIFYFWQDELVKGITLLYDEGAATIAESMYWDEHVMTYEWDDSFYSLTNSVVILLSLLFQSLICFFIAVKPSFIALFLLTFPFFEIGAAFGAVPDYFYFSLMIASWTSALVFSIANKSKIVIKNNKRKFFGSKLSNVGIKRYAGLSVIAAILTVFLFFAGREALFYIDFNRTQNIDLLRQNVKLGTDNAFDYMLGKDNDGSLKEGKLLEVDDHRVLGRHYFTLTTNLKTVNEPILIRGYSATYYNGKEWGQTSNYKKYKSLFNDLDSAGYRMGGINGNMIAEKNSENTWESVQIFLSDFRRPKEYVYETYFADFGKEYSPLMDYSVKSENNKEYNYNAYIGSEYLYDILESDTYNSEEYRALFAEYSEFVKTEYTSSKVTKRVQKLADSLKYEDIYDSVYAVREYLSENLKYTFIVNKSPKNADFVENLLFETKKGYSTHYATAATVLLQACGVPTRYVEGYAIPDSDFNKTKVKKGIKTFDVTDMYAHAWIEVFDDVYGWIPIDVSPQWAGSFGSIADKHKDYAGEKLFDKNNSNTKTNYKIIKKSDKNSKNDKDESDKMDTVNKLSGFKFRPIYIVISLASLLIIAVITLLIRRFIVNLIRKRRMLGDGNTVLCCLYGYFIKLTEFEGVNLKGIYSYDEIKNAALQNSSFVEKERTELFFNVMMKNGYSPQPISEEEIAQAREFVSAYSQDLFKSLSPLKRISFKYIYNL